MNIQNITIINFKGFSEKYLNFNNRMTVLIGDNGSGKTSVLEALSFVIGTFFHRIEGANARTLKDFEKRRIIVSPESFETQLPFKISVSHTFEGENYNWSRESNKIKGGVSYKDANDLINRGKKLSELIRSNEETVNLPLLAYYGTERLAEKKQKIAYAKKSSRIDGYYGALDPRSIKRKFLEWFKTFEDSALKFNKDKTLYNAFTNAITEMVPEWKNIHFSWEANDMMGQLKDDSWMPFSQMSDGYKNIIRISADIAYRAIKLNPHLGGNAITETEGVVLIDEIDMHLHPKWQSHIINDFKRTFPKIQFIVTTHSPFVVQSLSSNEIIDLNGNISEENPSDLSIDQNISFMGVENLKSNYFSSKEKVVNEYLDVLNNSTNSETEILESLDELLIQVSNDPVLVAKLKIERISKLGE
ncbi:AAA family ATPase [Tenacibaculum finnmarkense]|uniref:AAA family ATPase n=1 Tax=Tenacibaculum finnmarkense TaxID=2781243 RepID=UPI001EFA5528|nr:AAA family ATPase [Tenacibaculum finnmarkense]MCG8208165.1 AAA family ATPase [Tenacibaculum finnmarkense genomovar finnmarkense]MCG8724161.1 AAA family ATPase [Tenacibaculum finnmarkense]MCG8765876.1 AAA family ATPase [Tenacibaculum finnmarkense]MCG8778814.1 AAA family ATPase [Tenacibaculum finnmarkense]MCM8907290.1 AAA family ATPase [Tenacibaculum finnmarkense genomovar finnmarkense]